MADIKLKKIESDADIAYGYDLFTRSVKKTIIDQRGFWKEEDMQPAFRKRFNKPETTILWHGKKRIGYFQLSDNAQRVYLSSVYIEPEYQKHGLGRKVVEMGLEAAKRKKKPFLLHVLKDSSDSIDRWSRLGFQMTGKIDMAYFCEAPEMVHKDTAPFMAPAPQAGKKARAAKAQELAAVS